MPHKSVDCSLYFCTADDTSINCVAEAIRGGVTVIQLRAKNLSGRDFFRRAVELREVTRRLSVPLIINDRADIALAVDADGVHVGQKDLPCREVRRLMGEGKIIGVSAATVDEALEAQADGANYIGAGAVFTTSTKQNTRALSLDVLKRIVQAVEIPVVAIGGIKQDNAAQLIDTGISGIAVVSAIASAADPCRAAAELKQIWSKQL